MDMKKVNKLAKEMAEFTRKVIEEVRKKEPSEFNVLPVVVDALNEKGTKGDQSWDTLPKPSAGTADPGKEKPESSETIDSK